MICAENKLSKERMFHLRVFVRAAKYRRSDAALRVPRRS
jgi:hypothetical protein